MAAASSSLIHFPNLTTTNSHRRVNLSSNRFVFPHKAQPLAAVSCSLSYKSKITSSSRERRRRAIEQGKEENSATKFENEGGEELKKETLDVEDQLGAEIREAMKVKKEEEEKVNVNFWYGVIEEIKEIEWPVFGKVLGTTGVVIGVVAGSSVVLLTVNALLAEFSNQVFAGRGVQDFFG